MKWIAVDYGERRTGLAVCDASELIVTPVTPQIEEKSLNKVAEAAAAARLAQGAEGVVCGLPRNMDGTEGSRCVKSRRFAARLATACGVPVVLWDELRTGLQRQSGRVEIIGFCIITEADVHHGNGGRHSFGQQHLWRRPQSSAGFGFRRSDLGKFSGMAQSPPRRRTAGGCRAHCPGASITRRFSHA